MRRAPLRESPVSSSRERPSPSPGVRVRFSFSCWDWGWPRGARDPAEAPHRLKAGASVVVGAFPEAHLKLAVEQPPFARHSPVPFAAAPVDEPRLDEVPGAEGGLEEALLPRDLEGVDEADHRLGLGPPFLVGV